MLPVEHSLCIQKTQDNSGQNKDTQDKTLYKESNKTKSKASRKRISQLMAKIFTK